jgi:hypothetical protein
VAKTGATVGEVMSDHLATAYHDETLRDVATEWQNTGSPACP